MPKVRPPPNKSLDRSHRQRTSHQSDPVLSWRVLAGGGPVNSTVRCSFSHEVRFDKIYKSLDRSHRQRTSHQSDPVLSWRVLAGGGPVNSTVRCSFSHEVRFDKLN